MDGQVIHRDGEMATEEVPLPDTEQGDHAKPPLDGSRFHDQSRLASSEITRAFASAIRAVEQGPQSEVSARNTASLDPDGAVSDVEIVRGSD